MKVNGEPTEYFLPSRGIHQGDPISPYLFIIVANVLSTLLKKAADDGSIKRIRLNHFCRRYRISSFADDLILFMEGKIVEYQNVVAILNQYCVASGQAINLNNLECF